MSSIHYSAAWTECGCLISCCHHHRSVAEAVACIRRAGGYVVAVQGGVVRSLTTQEEAEFQCVVPIDSTATEALQITLGPEEIPFDCGYAVMTRIRTGERWIWTTGMRFETYADAAAHARQGDKVVRFRSLSGRRYGSRPKQLLRWLSNALLERAFLREPKEKRCSNSYSDY